MADFDEIEDLGQLESWLKTQDPRMSRAIAARAVLRSLPAAMRVVDQGFAIISGKGLLLSCFRATLITGVASTCPTTVMTQVKSAARSARSAALSAALSALSARTAGSAAESAAESAAHSADSAGRSDAHTAALIAIRSAAKSDSVSAALSAVFTDATAGTNGLHADLFASPLWPETNHIGHLLEFWESFSARPDPDETWAFWRQWYQGMLTGTPMEWDLQLQVALIDDAVWDQGAEAVAREIERIRAKFNLEQEVKQLKEQLLSLQQITATPKIGDNGGPPLNDPEDIAFQTDLSQIWQRVEELENEIDSPTPSIDKLNAFADWFQVFFVRAAKYLGAKADIIFTKGCETLGIVGTTALIAYFTVTTAAQNETVHSLPKAILDVFKSLAGG
ncbi:hypothetical protein [Parasedimentitalea marina]|nr:hypothetical protein [Parasedimentitalea marina]